jgi:uncharacterized membrane-anchored protein
MTSPQATRRGALDPDRYAHLMNKVPEVTLYFWLIKVLCTTVGETFADYLNETLGLGLTTTTIVMGAAFVVALVLQFRAQCYVPSIYWVTVVLISVFGTLITDNLTDGHGVPTTVTTPIFAVLLGATFATWWWVERTLSIHTIRTPRREAFYWLAILFTFALGTAGGDMLSEQLGFGYFAAVLIFAAAIGVVAVLHWGLKVNAVLTFWLAYILTRPLGASIGDFMSQPRADGGLGLGTTATSVIFLAAILALVVYLTVTRVDVTEDEQYDAESLAAEAEAEAHHPHLLHHEHAQPAPRELPEGA